MGQSGKSGSIFITFYPCSGYPGRQPLTCRRLHLPPRVIDPVFIKENKVVDQIDQATITRPTASYTPAIDAKVQDGIPVLH